jgi:hypothetical protein
MGPGFLHRYHTGEYSHRPGILDLPTDCPQVRVAGLVAGVPAQSVCEVLNTESNMQNVVTTLVTDVVLLLTMLVGLLQLRPYGTIFGVGKLLWKQVGNATFIISDCLYGCRERV